MKIVSWKLSPALHSQFTLKEFFCSPYVSVRSLKHRPKENHNAFLKFAFFLLLTVTFVMLAQKFLAPLEMWEVILISPAVYFVTEVLGALGQLLFPFRHSFPIHQNPFLSHTLGNFWGRRWNLWVQDWLRDISQAFESSSHFKTITIAFLFSGLFHELMCNLPYWMLYRKSYFGTMMAYFLIQALALWVEKKYIRIRSIFWKRMYCWCAVIIPSPLFINVPMLTFLGLKHV